MSCFTALQINKAEEARRVEEARRAEEAKPKCVYWNPRNPSQCFRYK